MEAVGEAMKAILELIDHKARELAQCPIIRFLQDKSLDPRQRFSFVPCVAPWVFGFSDINKYVLRDDSSADTLQQMINTHTTEDDHHWEMYVADLTALEMNDARDYASTLKLLWGNESKKTRQVVYGIVELVPSANSVMRMVLLKAVEEASSACFKELFKVAEEFRALTGRRLSYFGDAHLEAESEHSMREHEAEEKLEQTVLTPEEAKQARFVVERVFKLIREMTDEFLAYAHRHPRPMPLPSAAGHAAVKSQPAS
jgi:hypothetical protein